MKLYAVINSERYEVGVGSTFSEEYNETLDSGSIIFDQIPRIRDLKPYDDVFVNSDPIELPASFYERSTGTAAQKGTYLRIQATTLKGLRALTFIVYSLIRPTSPGLGQGSVRPDPSQNYRMTCRFKRISSTSSGAFIVEFETRFSGGFIFDHGINVNSQDSTSTLTVTFTSGTHQGEQVWNGKVSSYTSGSGTVPLTFSITQKPIISEFYKHMLVDDFSEELNNVITKSAAKYKYKINLFSETKRLEKVILPNISITQPVDKSIRRSVWEYLNVYLNLYSPKIKVVDDLENNTWKYENKYSLSDRVRKKFEGVDAPEMSVTNPTLRDIITQLMLVKDCIPVVHDDVIDYLDVSERNGEFSTDPTYVNYVHSSMSSGGYSLEARREYSGAISQENSARLIEYLGFRNSNTSILTIDNLVLETRFPIYKINKIYMCYYKTTKLYNESTEQLGSEFKFLCKQDITPLVLQNVVRNAMSQDYLEFDRKFNYILKTEDLAKYKICTVGYDIGSNRITGWGEKYTFYPTKGWFVKTNTVLQNIISFMDQHYAFGYRGYKFINDNENVIPVGTKTGGISSIETGSEFGNDSNDSVRQKAVFFEIDYNAMFSGAIVHTKDDVEDDDITTADNCSSSLTVLEADGLFEKEKMNRFANRTYNIQARYNGHDAFNKMELTCNHVLGSVYKNEDEGIDDVVIYHREISVYDHFIIANFAGTFDYVLKNYFTSVFAKLRTYNLATYGESIVRAENYREYLLLSADESYYDSDSIAYPVINKFFTAFNQTTKLDALNSYRNEDKINFSYIQYKTEGTDSEINRSRSFSDTNVFVSGKIICINLKMYDNATTGVYIENSYLANAESQTSGSLQNWKVSLDKVLDPFQKVVLFGFGHAYSGNDEIPFGKQLLIPENNYTGEVGDIYSNQLLKFPNFYDTYYLDTSIKFYITTPTSKQIIYKDNKEIIDFTFQFEPYSINSDVILSQWFSKLSDINGAYNKWFSTSHRSDVSNLYFEPTHGQIQKNTNQVGDWDRRIKFVLQYNYDDVRFLFTNYEYYADYENWIRWQHTFPEPGKESTTTPVNVVKTGISYGPDDRGYYGYIFYFRLVGIITIASQGVPSENTDIVNMIFRYDRKKYYLDGTIVDDLIDEEMIKRWNSSSYYTDFDVDVDTATHIVTESFIVKFDIPEETTAHELYSETTDDDINNSIFEDIIFGCKESLDTYENCYKNMFVIVSSEKLKKEIVYDTYLSQKSSSTASELEIVGLPSSMTIVNTDDSTNQYDSNTYIPFNNLFRFSRVNNYPKIIVGNIELNKYPDFQSIQFWYLDNNGDSPEGRLQFVFGVNTDEHETEVYVSAMSRKSPKVYTADHKTVAGEIFNSAEEGLFIEANKMVTERYVGNIYYENISDSTDTGFVVDVAGYTAV